MAVKMKNGKTRKAATVKAAPKPKKMKAAPRKIAIKAAPKMKAAKKADIAKNAKALKGKAVKAKEVKAPQLPKVDEAALRKRIAAILSVSNVRQMLIELGGENALAIIRNFEGNRSDEELAKKLKIKISDVRATLNKLHNEGLVNYIREKDSETGWYSYSWTLNHQRMERWATTQAPAIANVGEDGKEYYYCPACGAESLTNFEAAVGCEFRCERCDKLLEFIDDKGMTELFEKKK